MHKTGSYYSLQQQEKKNEVLLRPKPSLTVKVGVCGFDRCLGLCECFPWGHWFGLVSAFPSMVREWSWAMSCRTVRADNGTFFFKGHVDRFVQQPFQKDYFVMGPCFIVIKQLVVDWGGWLIEHCLRCRSRLCPLFNGKSLKECSFSFIWKSSACFYRNIAECQYLVAFRQNEIVVSEVFTSELLCCCLWCCHVFIIFLSYYLWFDLEP